MVQPLPHEFPFAQGIFTCNDEKQFHPLVCSPWIALIHLVDGHATIIAHQQKYHLKKDDVIVLMGKGHETYQIIGTEKRHLDEREVIAAHLQTLRREKEQMEK